ncbi:tetratricopeptide repeat protein [Methanobrevibacter thaueri]|uniref:Photosystem I assembly protein Ycf3 n=1 Tax=Methanobrevibacter thaueri TaxID=190975 RepID=A0A315XQM1_9EURY|nr:tetratricopeptide repeat protein [Methanobrevibacter thaueri]PWB88244.1 photosystem I assembly protein Ycf3 [Methanobrevibacter thaueri]
MSQENFENKIDEAYELIQYDAGLALKVFENLLKLDPDNIDLLNGKGSALMKLKRFSEAEECFNKSVLINENSCALLNKGIISKHKNEFQSALKFYDRAVQLDSSLCNIALILKNEVIEAIDDNILNYNSFSNESNEYIKRGIDFRDEGKFCDAMECFRNAVECDLACKPSVLALMEEVKTLMFNEFMFKTPDLDDEAIYDLKMQFFRALLVEEDPAKALTLMDFILDIKGNDLDTLNFKGCILFLFEEYCEAILCFDKCLDIDGQYYYALFNKGLVLGIMSEFKEALLCFEVLLKEHKYEEKAEFYRQEILEKIDAIS